MLGKMVGSWAEVTPNHWARVAAYWTLPVVGAQRPFEPESSGPLRTGVGKVTYILPPLAPPPMTMWWEPQAWSEPVGVGLEGVACSLAWSLSARFFPPIPGYWQPVSFRLS
jgi:hypothetical protein